MWTLRAVLLEQVDAAEVADARRRSRSRRRSPATPTAMTANSEYSPLATLKPANSIVASEGIGRQALSPTISRKTPSSPSLSMTSTANWTSGSVMEARPARPPRVGQGASVSGRLDPRQRQRGDALLRARRRAPDVGLRPQHLEDHHRLVDVGGDAPGGGRRRRRRAAARRRRCGARDDQLALARPQRARRPRRGASSTASVTAGAPRRGRGSASARPPRARRRCGALSSGTSPRPSVPCTSIWCTTSSSRCSRTSAASPAGRYGTQGLGE